MGRTSKFTFPVPGRKQKKPTASEPADISAPLTKAQKILGTGGLNVDTPVASKDHARLWETRSNSGISISISESTASYTNEASLGRLDEDDVVHGVSGRHARWDEESAIIPRARNGGGTRGNVTDGNDTGTDASSLRRQRSSSTINTYYDKSKVPLSISQQTASSAMAKGLPKKASALLDMDGSSFDMIIKPRRQKPSRLDLSSLVHKPKSPRYLTPLDAGQRGFVLGPDMLARSPSVMSASPDMSPQIAYRQPDRKPRKTLTLETIRGNRLEPMPGSGEGPSLRIRTASSVNELHNLYEHYEQLSFDEITGHDRPGTNRELGSSSPEYEPAHASCPGLNEPLAAHSKHVSRPDVAGRIGVETPTISVMTPLSLKLQPTDTASISSRHTRTSKASRRTDLSLTDIDLRQNSVLSLSSDSEDDYEDRPITSTSLSAPRRRSGTVPSPTSPTLNNFPLPPSPLAAEHRPHNPPSRGSVSPRTRTQFVPHENAASKPQITPPKIAPRTSSLSASSETSHTANNSRFSDASTVTAGLVQAGSATVPARDDGPSKEFRPVALIPAQGFRRARNSVQQSPHRRVTRLSTSSDQSLPLSPTSIDFYLQSQHNSMTFDASSIRSGHSMRSSIASTVAGDDGHGRFIAVTRQEEMLLAALRNKRARMRDEIIAEFEEEQDEQTANVEGMGLQHPKPQSRHDQHTLGEQASATDLGLPAEAPRQRPSRDSKRSSGRQVSRNSSMSTVKLASLPEQPAGEQQQQELQPRLSEAGSSKSSKTRREVLSQSSCVEQQTSFHVEHPSKGKDTNLPSQDATSSELDDFSDFDYLSGDVNQPGGKPSFETVSSFNSSPSASMSNLDSKASSQNLLTEADLFPAVPISIHKKPLRSRFHKLPPAHGVDVDAVYDRNMAGDSASSSSSHSNVVSAAGERDMARPDSPISPVVMDLPSFATKAQLPKKKQVRLSAVGFRGVETGLWGDDG